MRVVATGKPGPGTIGKKLRNALLDTLPADFEPNAGAIVLRIRFVFRRESAAQPATPLHEPSLAALTRGVLDELPGFVYADERQIAALHAGKEYGNADLTELSW